MLSNDFINERAALEAYKFYMISHRTALGATTQQMGVGTGTHSTTRDITNAYPRQSRMHVTMARVHIGTKRGGRAGAHGLDGRLASLVPFQGWEKV